MSSQAVFCSPFTHRIAIQMSAEGRFLICLDCELRFEFPSETPYLALTHEFASHACQAAAPKACGVTNQLGN